MLTPRDALRRILRDARALPGVSVPLAEALGRCLAEPIDAVYDSPSFDNSAMDGYAVHSADVQGASASSPIRLPVVGESKAGDSIPGPLAAGSALRIFTGAPMPPGADAVVVQEDTSRDGEDVLIGFASNRGRHVRPRAEDFARATRLLERGHLVGPGSIALIASQSIATVSVHRAPRVAVVSTGDELRLVGSTLEPGQIANSNGPMLEALIRGAGGVATLLQAPDELDSATATMRAALDDHDLVLSTGGVSVGDHDVVKRAMNAAGVDTHFWKIAIKPGKPVVFGSRPAPEGETPVIGLPGNPASAFVTFTVFVRPLLRVMLGDPKPYPEVVRGVLGASVKHRPGRLELLRARRHDDRFELHASQGSGSLAALSHCDVLVEIPPDAEHVAEGTELRAIQVGSRGATGSPWP